MKLTKREKKILYILGGTVLLLIYFNFIITPQIITLGDLKQLKDSHYNTLQEVETAMSSKESVKKEIVEMKHKLRELNYKYDTSIDQGSIILLLEEWANKANLAMPSISFSEYRVEELAELELDVITVTIPFEGSYHSLIDFLKTIRNYEKSVVIGQLQIQNNFNDYLEGDILLEFHSLRDGPAKKENFNVVEVDINRNNPFLPFKGYIAHIYDIWQPDNKLPNPSQGNNTGSTNPSLVTLTLNDFETMNAFFVGEPRETVGELNLSPTAMGGRHSLQLEYDFLRSRQRAVANVVLEGDRASLNLQPEKVQLSVYSYASSNHKISLALRDGRGREHIVPLAHQINWTGWRKLEGIIPIGATYPVEMQRIVISAEDFSPITKGILLIDQLEAVYPAGTVIKSSTPSTLLGENTIYEVKAGDTLFSITDRFYQDFSKRFLIMEANNITDSAQIYVGQRLVIPDGNDNLNTPREDVVEYVVRQGDTLFSISRQFYNDGSKRHLIMEKNSILDPNELKVGQRLLIPRL